MHTSRLVAAALSDMIQNSEYEATVLDALVSDRLESGGAVGGGKCALAASRCDSRPCWGSATTLRTRLSALRSLCERWHELGNTLSIPRDVAARGGRVEPTLQAVGGIGGVRAHAPNMSRSEAKGRVLASNLCCVASRGIVCLSETGRRRFRATPCKLVAAYA